MEKLQQIEEKDSLNKGRVKLNKAILGSEKAIYDSNQAFSTANEAKQQSESTQQQLDTIVIEGDSSVEAAQARIDREGHAYTTLKERLDSEQQHEIEEFSKVNLSFARVNSNIGNINKEIEEIKNKPSVHVSKTEPLDADIWFEVVE